ncbi:Polygalacturonase [Dysgonomonas macrotermitis]|uniref:Polygalacturonase n=2 Tax=Dysgonomonas macrotermitis TaxID=1346286 RepID=A0A1M5GIK9_9BACT|nr:Polygalacturonase [Dysgonomonas macrotermitis]
MLQSGIYIKKLTSHRNEMKKSFLCLAFLLCLTGLQAKIYNIKDLGADTTGKNTCTQLINESIQKAAAEGGGTIYFPAGNYLTAAIHLESNITLDIESGAVLRFSDKFEEYLPFVKVRWEGVFMNSLSPLIYADGVENITIKGRGVIDGQGHAWWKESRQLIDEIRANGKTSGTNKLQQMWLDANKDIKVSPYYESTLERKFFRPPFIQFHESKNIVIEGITIINSPFWTINPIGCDDIIVHGVTINNPSKNPKGHNTDGINPESCRNVRISDCFISVGDDCITIKSGRDEDGRKYGRPCENITITNCIMLAGHGGVVIGSEMSGGVKKVAISNCVFNGTDAGIRLKSSRGRGGVVEEIRVDNIVMNDIQRNAFIFDLFYDKDSKEEPVSERTPAFRNIHISNVTGNDIKKVGYITGIKEMPISEISFSNINMVAEVGFTAKTAKNIQFHNVDLAVKKGASFAFDECTDIVLNNVRSKAPLAGQPIVELNNVTNGLINNCFQITPADVFCKEVNSQIIWGNNFLDNVKTVKIN